MTQSSSVEAKAALPRRYRLKTILEELDRKSSVGRDFLIHYTLRNQTGKPGYGARGASSKALIDLYAEELRWTSDFLAGVGLKRHTKRRRNVYVFDLTEAEGLDPAPQVIIDPLGKGDDESLCVILPSRTSLPSSLLELFYLRAATDHECTHIVCADQKGLDGAIPRGTGLDWFSEGTAEWVALTRARQLTPGHIQSFEFLGDWCAYPEVPIIDEDTWYSSVVYLDYLERRKSARWIADLWREATFDEDDDPWKKIQSSLGDGSFVEFCCDAYFLNDPKGKLHSPDLFERFGPRGWEHSYEGSTNGWIPSKVHDFSCRYFAVHPSKKIRTLHFQFETNDPAVRAVLLGVDREYREVGGRVSLQPGTTPIPVDGYSGIDHFVLTVTTEPTSSAHDLKYRSFRFQVSFWRA